MIDEAKRIDGWMGKKSLRWLARMARGPQRVAEVGVWMGRSTKALAHRNTGIIWAVDTWEGVPDDSMQSELYTDPEHAHLQFQHHLRNEIATGQVVPLRMTSLDAAAQLLADGVRLDMVFVDADHRYEACRDDIRAWSALVKRGGIIAGHDYGWPGVNRAVKEELPQHENVVQAIWVAKL